MELTDRIRALYDKDTKTAYANLRELEALSEEADALYPYLDAFLEMLGSDKYVIRVRGFRLLCKQAKWDEENKINRAMDRILNGLCDEKPTAVRQALQALEDVVPYKQELQEQIKAAALSIDLAQFKDTMQPLIAKDIACLTGLIDME